MNGKETEQNNIGSIDTALSDIARSDTAPSDITQSDTAPIDTAPSEAGTDLAHAGYTGIPVTYYPINETAARRAKEMNSFFDYQPGSATKEYRHCVDEAVKIAEQQKERADPIYHEKIDRLVDAYAWKLADNMNKGYEITARVPSVMIASASNFPVRKKEKQNAASDKNMEEWRQIQGLLDQIRSTGMGGIRSDHPHAVELLEQKLGRLESTQKLMKDVNAFYRKNKTLDGCTLLDGERIHRLKASMERSWHPEPKPFPSYQLTNNNAEIRRLKHRIEELKQNAEVGFCGWEFDGGETVANQDAGRLQLLFEEKPSAEHRAQLKANGFRWAPKEGAWQRLLNRQAVYAAERMEFIRPLSGQTPSELQPKAEKKPERSMER